MKNEIKIKWETKSSDHMPIGVSETYLTKACAWPLNAENFGDINIIVTVHL